MNILPQPRDITLAKGHFNLTNQTAHVNLSTEGHTPKAIQHKLKTLNLSRKKNSKLPLHTIVIGEAPPSLPKPPQEKEGYVLASTKTGIALRAKDADGLFWALVTLEQMANGSRSVPCASIIDYPAYPFRMHHDDISRKQISTLEDFKTIIRRLSSYKINFYSPYMEDVLFLKSFPDIGLGRGRLTTAEVNAMHKEARLHNITLMPTYSLIGHQENVLALPQYRKYAREVFQEPSAYDVTKPILKPFLRKVIKDVCDLFSDSPYFHAGFDEVIGLTEKEFIDHANWCAKELKKHGKKMFLWTDMFKNHYGFPAIHKLHKNILPTEWEYDAPHKQKKAFKKAKVTPYALAGYNNWCAFLPDFSRGKQNIDAWAEVMQAWDGPGFGSSMWGDNGYENQRDLCWNLFAYYGDVSWTGKPGTSDFEERFQNTFYGGKLPLLQKLVEKTATQRAITPTRTWQLFRLPINSYIRLVISEPKIVHQAQSDLKAFKTALRDLAKSKTKTQRNADHLDHLTSAIQREMSVYERILLADKITRGLKGKALEKALASAIKDLARVKAFYKKIWLRHNKQENIEVSLAVYDVVSASLRAFAKKSTKTPKRFHCLDLRKQYNQCIPAVGGIPIGSAVIDKAPFLFAEKNKTHFDITKQKPFSTSFQPTSIRDIHLMYGGQGIKADPTNTSPIIELTLRYEGKIVHREKLLALRHICDWWAPEGNHMWAGGGLKYIDPSRVNLAMKSGEYYGLMHLKGFACKSVIADQIEIKALKKGPHIALFAATLERE